MQKKMITLFLCICLICSCFLFVGCDNSKTKEDVSTLFKTMKEDDEIKDFFEDNKIVISLNGVNVSSSNKGYIFPAIFDYYIEASSCLFFNIIDRFDKSGAIPDPVAYSVKDFSKKQINDIYSKLNNVYNNLKLLANSKMVYETMNANLHYKNLVENYCNVINSLYMLNFSYADYYFSYAGYVDFSLEESELSDDNVKSMLSLILLNISKVSYDYEILNYTISNPLGEIKNSFLDKTTYVKPFLTLCFNTLNNIKNQNNIALIISSKNNTLKVKKMFKNIQSAYLEFKNEYELFCKALNSFDAKNYFLSNNKQAYIESCSNISKSSFSIINNFLNGRYAGLCEALNLINSYI